MTLLTVKTWDGNNINDGTNYSACLLEEYPGLPRLSVGLAGRSGRWPLAAGLTRPGHHLTVQITVEDMASLDRLKPQLLSWFDPEDEEPKALVANLILDDPDNRDVYVEAICEEMSQMAGSQGKVWLATLVVHGDVRWRGVGFEGPFDEVTDMTSSPHNVVLGNDGDDVAYPRIEIKPEEAKTLGYAYKRWVAIRWRATQGYQNYPLDIANAGLDTASLVSGGKMQADGDDLRVWVDGAEVDRWLNGMNGANTKVWCNLTFQAAAETTLAASIASSGAVDTIDVHVDADITGFPEQGIVMIDSEAFVYTGKNNAARRFTGVTRAQRGTSMAAHSVGATVWWVQHDINIVYGNSGAATPSVDGDMEPMFNRATSTNISWDYDDFGFGSGGGYVPRPGGWQNQVASPLVQFYGGNQGSEAATWAELGMRAIKNKVIPSFIAGRRWLYNPCGITNANFQNGEKQALLLDQPVFAEIQEDDGSGKWQTATGGSIAEPTLLATWQSWSANIALASGMRAVALYIEVNEKSEALGTNYVEAADCTVSLNNSFTPVTTVGAEQGNYDLNLSIINTSHPDFPGLQVTFNMALNERLVIDTANKTVTHQSTLLADLGQHFNAVTLRSVTLKAPPRRDWLPLLPGNNTITFSETNVQRIAFDIRWQERFYG